MKAKALCLLAIAIGIGISVPSPLVALDSETNRATLKGLRGIRVLVEDLAPEVEREGLVKDELQKGVEQRLQAAGIRILTQEEAVKTPGEPYLYVNINITFSKDKEICSYSMDAALIQNVTLARSPKQNTYAVTWSTGGVGLISRKSLKELRETMEEIADIFAKAFLGVNPKK